jgi:hypothetical protein
VQVLRLSDKAALLGGLGGAKVSPVGSAPPVLGEFSSTWSEIRSDGAAARYCPKGHLRPAPPVSASLSFNITEPGSAGKYLDRYIRRGLLRTARANPTDQTRAM